MQDVPLKYIQSGHAFLLGENAGVREVLYSFDVCGGCEAHAIEVSLNMDKTLTVETSPLLSDLDAKVRVDHEPIFKYCPSV